MLRSDDSYILEQAALLAYDLEDAVGIQIVEQIAADPSRLKGRRFKGNGGEKRAASMLATVAKQRSKRK